MYVTIITFVNKPRHGYNERHDCYTRSVLRITFNSLLKFLEPFLRFLSFEKLCSTYYGNIDVLMFFLMTTVVNFANLLNRVSQQGESYSRKRSVSVIAHCNAPTTISLGCEVYKVLMHFWLCDIVYE